ncbi:hypothetical protein SAMN05216553_101795 [Lentzea fradiae]|uniref:Excreted virulence factor EspC, type VII ESX diderm n=1 Tax=Lentzea fradiae TaxID=200378 RepID=A0A1G7LCN7_9PSEU|nr:hypothetical protein [Lentzea fradiae]SDF47287.1 hypothetical protein SAMN05216553_101795 [Lentzea fradiae]
MKFQVQPEALTAFAEGSDSLAEKFGALAKLLEQARVDDQCFGPIGDAVGLSSGYLKSLQECQQLATDAQKFLKQTGEQLQESFEVYRGVDDGISKAFGQIGRGLGSGA